MSLRIRIFKAALLAAAFLGLSIPAFAYDWQKVAPKNGGFSADFPGKPLQLAKAGKDISGHAWIYGDKQQNLIVAVTRIDNYGGHRDANTVMLLEKAKFIRRMNGKQTSSKRASFSGANGNKLPELIYTFIPVSGSGMAGICRSIMDGDTLYVVRVMRKKGFDASQVRKRFMASFKLLPRIRPPEPEGAEK